MRAIKFRAWHKKRMWYLLPWRFKYNDGGFSHFFNGHNAPQKEVVLMQFTGLKDKNGKEIYEGDIIRYSQSHDDQWAAVIEYIDFGLRIKYIAELWDYDDIEELANDKNWIEVIGNIYENSELI